MRNPPADAAGISVDEETLSIYLAQIHSYLFSDEPGAVGILRGIIGDVLNGFPSPTGDPEELRREAQRYAAARDAATTVRTTLLTTQDDLLHAWLGVAGDGLQTRFNESMHKVGALIDDYHVGYSVLLSYASTVQTAQHEDAEGRALLAKAGTALAPLRDYEPLNTPQTGRIISGARQDAEEGCRKIFEAVGSLGSAFIDVRYRLNTQMQVSRSIIGGAVPDIDNPHGREVGNNPTRIGTDPAAGVGPDLDAQTNAREDAPVSDGRLSAYTTGFPDGALLPIVVPPDAAHRAVSDRPGAASARNAVPRSRPGAPVSESLRESDDTLEAPIAPTAGKASTITPTPDSAEPAPSPSPGPAPITPRPGGGTTAGPATP